MLRNSLEDLAYYLSTGDLISEEYLEQDTVQRFGATRATVDLEQGILRFFAQKAEDPTGALRQLDMNKRQLRIFLETIIADSSLLETLKPDDEVANILQLFKELNIPLIVKSSIFEGVSQIKRDLLDYESNMHRITPEHYLLNAGIGWGYLETLLTVCIEFYAKMFPTVSIFEKAKKASGLNNKLDAVRSIQKEFEKREESTDTTHDETDIQEDLPSSSLHEAEFCWWYLGRNTPFNGFLQGQEKVEFAEHPRGWLEYLVRFDNRLQAIVPQDQEALTSKLAFYKAYVSYYRNFYAHSNVGQWRNSGMQHVKASFERAREIINQLSEFCPELIVLIEEGQDVYGRKVVRFIGENNFKDTLVLVGNGTYCFHFQAYKHSQIMFIPRRTEIKLNQFYLCPRPATNGMFEPNLIPADPIIQKLEFRNPGDWLNVENE